VRLRLCFTVLGGAGATSTSDSATTSGTAGVGAGAVALRLRPVLRATLSSVVAGATTGSALRIFCIGTEVLRIEDSCTMNAGLVGASASTTTGP